MTSTPPGPGAFDRVVAALHACPVRRRSSRRWLGGVCSGIGDRFGLDPALVRVVWVLLTVFGGFGLTAYACATCLLPDDRDRVILERAVREGEGSSITLVVLAAASLMISVVNPVLDLSTGTTRLRLDPSTLLLTAVVVGAGMYLWRRRGTPSGAVGPVGSAGREPLVGGWVEGTAPHDGPVAQDAPSVDESPAPAIGMLPAAARRARRRRATAGWQGLLVVVGMASAAYASVRLLGVLARGPQSVLPHEVVPLAAALLVASLAAVAIGLSGRRSGGVGLLVLVLALATLVAGIPRWTAQQWSARDADATRWRPTTVSSGQRFEQTTGGAVLDLTGLPASQLDGRTIRAEVGAGALRIVVPPDRVVLVRSRVGLGGWQRIGDVLRESARAVTATGPQSGGWERRATVASAGIGLDHDTLMGAGPASPQGPTPKPVLTVDAQVAAGTITVEAAQ